MSNAYTIMTGPIPKSDSKFMRRIRVHQAWYRQTILGLTDFGTLSGSGAPCCSVLPANAAERHLNFVGAAASAEYLKRRQLGWGVDPVRCTSYMTSSQTLTFNMLSEATLNQLEFAATMNTLLDRHDFDRLESIDFEFAAQGSGFGLGDNTLVDALLRLRTVDGGLQIVAIEAKLADRFSTRRTRAAGGPKYQEVAKSGPIWTDLGTAVSSNKTRQLTRCHALAQSVQRREDASRRAALVVLHHPLDMSATNCIDEYAKLVHRGVFAGRTWDEFVNVASCAGSISTTMAKRLTERYLNLALSEPLWREVQRSSAVRSY